MGVYDSLLTPQIRSEIEDARAGRPEFYTDPFDPLFGSSVAYVRNGTLETSFDLSAVSKVSISIRKTKEVRTYKRLTSSTSFTKGIKHNIGTKFPSPSAVGGDVNCVPLQMRIRGAMGVNGMARYRSNVNYTVVTDVAYRLEHSFISYKNDNLTHWTPKLRVLTNGWMHTSQNRLKMKDGVIHNLANKSFFAVGYNSISVWKNTRLIPVPNTIITPSALPVPTAIPNVFHPLKMVLVPKNATKSMISLFYDNPFYPRKIDMFIFPMRGYFDHVFWGCGIFGGQSALELPMNFIDKTNGNKVTRLTSFHPGFAASKCCKQLYEFQNDALTKMTILLRMVVRGEISYKPLRPQRNELLGFQFMGIFKHNPALYKTGPMPPLVFGRSYGIVTVPGDRQYGRMYTAKN